MVDVSKIKVGDRVFEIDADMAGHVQRYVDLVRSVPGELLVEQRLAACAQIERIESSVYRWQGALQATPASVQ